MRRERQTFSRTCIECGAKYSAVLQNSRFCNSTCRAANWRSTKRSGTQPSAHETPENGHELAESLPMETKQSNDTALGLQIAVELLQQEADRWHGEYREERTKRKALEKEIADSTKERMRLEHKHAIEALQNNKPDIMQRMLAGIGNLPSPFIEQLMPLVGRLGNLVVPPQPSAELSGTSNQVQPLIDWIQSLPEEVRHKLLVTLQRISELSDVNLFNLLNEIQKYLEPGSRITRPPPPDLSMWGD